MDNSTPIIPVLSVVMPLYNKGREVGRAIESVLSQAVQEFELIVVNDGSADNGADVVRSYHDSRIKIIEQTNAGVSAARNRGIREASADLIAFLDADDEWKPDFLETILKLKNKFPTCSVFATNYLFSFPDGTSSLTILRGIPKDFSEGTLKDYFAIASISDPPLWSSAVAITRDAINSIGGFPVGITSGEDLLTWARLTVRYDIAYSTRHCAVFWMPMALADRPGRVPQNPDSVGLELEKLLEYAGTKKASLKNYIALWHRMRANIFMRSGERKQAVQELKKAISFSGIKVNLAVLVFFSILPGKFGIIFHDMLRGLQRRLLVKLGDCSHKKGSNEAHRL